MSKLHEDLRSHHTVKTASDFSFGITFSIVFLIISGALFFKGSNYSLPLTASLFFLIISYAKAKLLSPFNKAWTSFGLFLNKITQPLIMFLLFFGFLTPFAFIYRLFGKKDLQLSFDTKLKTYWINKTPYATLKESMKNQF